MRNDADEVSLPALLAELHFIDKKLLEGPQITHARTLNRELRLKMLLQAQ